MERCWNINPEHRPSFGELVGDLFPHVAEEDRNHYVLMTKQFAEANELEDERVAKRLSNVFVMNPGPESVTTAETIELFQKPQIHDETESGNQKPFVNGEYKKSQAESKPSRYTKFINRIFITAYNNYLRFKTSQ